MTLQRFAKNICGAIVKALACLIVVGLIWSVVESSLTVYPTTEMQTRFLQSYTPDQTIDRFRNSMYSSGEIGSTGAAAGRGFATHERNFDYSIVVQYADCTNLMAALDKEMAFQLTSRGAQVMSHARNDVEGIHLRYVAGKVAGAVIIKPPELISNPERFFRRPLGPGEIAVRMQIRIEETWFRAGVPS